MLQLLGRHPRPRTCDLNGSGVAPSNVILAGEGRAAPVPGQLTRHPHPAIASAGTGTLPLPQPH